MRDILILGWIFGTLPMMFFRPFYGLVCFTILAYNRTQDLSWGIAGTLPLSEIVALAMIAGFFVNHKGAKFISDRRHWLMILLAVWIGLSVVFAYVPALGYRKLSEFLKIVLVAIMTPCLTDTREKMRVMMWAIALSFGFYGVKNALLHETILRGPGGLLADNNDFSSAMVMNLPFLLYLGHTEEKRWYKIGFYLAVPLTALTIAFTESRGGFLAMCVTFLALIAKSKRWYLSVMAAPFLAGLFFVIVPQKYIDRLKTIKEHKDASSQGRLKAWAAATHMAERHPFFGVGYRNFVYAYPRFANDPREHARVAHNSYFQLVGESGIPALAIFLLMIFVNWKNSRWIQKQARFLNAKSWIRNYAATIEVTTYGYVVAATFLNRAHFDLLYHVVGLTVALERLARAEFATIREERERAESEQTAEPATSPEPAPAPALST
jgi:probable O-glycosylation ligase (exosortase A-associated)